MNIRNCNIKRLRISRVNYCYFSWNRCATKTPCSTNFFLHFKSMSTAKGGPVDDHSNPAEKDLNEPSEGSPTDSKLSKGALKKLEKLKEKELRKAEVAARLASEKLARESQNDYAVDNYGALPLNQSAAKPNLTYTPISQITAHHLGKTILLTARIHVSRLTGAKMLFLTLRQKIVTVQSILCVDEKTVSKQMLKFATNISPESLVRIEAEVTKAPELIKSCTIQEYELSIKKVFYV